VIGFVVTLARAGSRPIYISGDTVWFDGAAEVARRFRAGVALPFAGAAQTRGPFHLTMDTSDTIETARAFPDAVIVPLHTDGWAHFRQNGDDLRATFDTLGFGACLKLLEPGVATVIEHRSLPDGVREMGRGDPARVSGSPFLFPNVSC
jgi:L-ascorbate metabolism protein UlaG (beta-lactamase superfamily)